MPKRDLVRRIDQRAATGTAGSSGSGAASGNADTVDGIHASRNPTAGMLLALDSSAKYPLSVLATTGADDNDLLAYDATAGEITLQTAAEAGVAAASHVHAGADITSGTISTDRYSAYADLTAETKIGTGSTQVAAGDHAHFSDAEGDPSALGTSADGVSAYAARRDHVHPDALTSDLDFATYKAVAMACDNGTSFPGSPATGQWYYRTDCDCLFMYEAAWKPIISFGAMTLYVDGTDGSDAAGQGFAADAGATATIQYAINLIPAIVGGNVIVYIAAGTYAESVIIPAKNYLGDYSIRIEGAKTTLDSGTMSAAKRNFLTAGTGKVNTGAGGSTTVTLSGGGATSAFWVGAYITANGVSRRVTAITDGTTITVDSTVDWYNAAAGYSWTHTGIYFKDSSKAWSDDAYNGQIVCVDTGNANPHTAMAFVEDTIAATTQINIAGYSGSSVKNYAIYSLDVAISGSGAFTIYATGVDIRYIKTTGSGVSFFVRYGAVLSLYGCDISGAATAFALQYGASVTIIGAYFHGGNSFCSLSTYSYMNAFGCWIVPAFYVAYCMEYSARFTFGYSRAETLYASNACLQIFDTAVCEFSGIVMVKGGSAYATGAMAGRHGTLKGISTGALFVGFTTGYSADAATFGLAT